MHHIGIRHSLQATLCALALAVACAGLQAPAVAQSAAAPGLKCAHEEVSGKGEPASYRWLAVLKARGNWRGKVRAMPRLGGAYANFAVAQNPVERCIFNTGSVVCTVTATPCSR